MRILAKLAARMEEITVGVGLEKKDGGRHRGRRFGGFVGDGRRYYEASMMRTVTTGSNGQFSHLLWNRR